MNNHLDMSCDDAVLVLWDFLKNEIDAAVGARVREHLAICPRCRARLAFERQFLASVGKVANDETDIAPLRSRILRNLTDHGFEPPPAA